MITKDEEYVVSDEPILEAERRRADEKLEYILCKGTKDGRDSYSIRVIQYKRGVQICRASACDVSDVYGEAKRIFDAISDGYVEPYILYDVVYDLLP